MLLEFQGSNREKVFSSKAIVTVRRSGLHPLNIFFTETFYRREESSYRIASTGPLITCPMHSLLSGDIPCKTTSIVDYQHISNNYCHRKIPKDQKGSPSLRACRTMCVFSHLIQTLCGFSVSPAAPVLPLTPGTAVLFSNCSRGASSSELS